MITKNFETLIFELKDNGIGIITLNRPERLNAMSFQLVEDYHEILDYLETQYDCRVVILRGAGKGFCSGLDLKEFPVLTRRRKPENLRKKFYYVDMPEFVKSGIYFQWRISQMMIKMRKINQPIISLIHGAATGGGFALALASDLRICGESAKFSNAFINLGLSGSDVSTSYHLPRLIGMSRATEILYTGSFFFAEEAERIGLVCKVVPDEKLLDAGMELAETLLTKSPLGLRMTKQALNASLNSPSLETISELENRAQILCGMSKDIIEGMSTFREKKKPRYPLR